MFVCFFQFSYFNRWKSLYVLIKTIKLNKKMLLTINTIRIGQMKSHNFITLVTTIRTCVGLPLFSCPGPTDDSAEAITTIALPSAPKWTPGEVCCSERCVAETLSCEGQLPPHSAAPSTGGSDFNLFRIQLLPLPSQPPPH